MKTQYTLLHCTFDKFGKIVTTRDTGLQPMTLKEAQTMKTKMMKPSTWLISPIN